jgi:hypothetical protein
MRKTLFVIGLFCIVGSLAVAQTKMSSTIKCGKNTVEHMVPVGDRPNHSFGVTQGSCTSSKPWTIAGVDGKEGTGTNSVEVDGATAKSHGVYVETMANGDQAHYTYQATVTTKDGKADVTSHKWQLVGGTGKLKGVKGQGTCKGSGTADGITYECEGEYTAAK